MSINVYFFTFLYISFNNNFVEFLKNTYLYLIGPLHDHWVMNAASRSGRSDLSPFPGVDLQTLTVAYTDPKKQERSCTGMNLYDFVLIGGEIGGVTV